MRDTYYSKRTFSETNTEWKREVPCSRSHRCHWMWPLFMIRLSPGTVLTEMSNGHLSQTLHKGLAAQNVTGDARDSEGACRAALQGCSGRSEDEGPGVIVYLQVGNSGDPSIVKRLDQRTGLKGRRFKPKHGNFQTSIPAPGREAPWGAGSPGFPSPTHAARAVGARNPQKDHPNRARGAGRPGIASELSTPAPALVCGGEGARVRGRGLQGRAGRVGWGGVELDETPCAREGVGRLAPHKHAPTQGEATAADTRTAGPGRKMAARHSPVTPLPSPPHWPAGS